MTAAVASVDVSSQSGGATLDEVAHHRFLWRGRRVDPPVLGTVGSEDVRDLEAGSHEERKSGLAEDATFRRSQ